MLMEQPRGKGRNKANGQWRENSHFLQAHVKIYHARRTWEGLKGLTEEKGNII